MEQLLLKLARQLDAMDEASLMGLWEKYANIVNQFEPSQRWQEAALVLSFIQAKRWKNQLFNTHWAARTRGGMDEPAYPEGLLNSPSGFTLEPTGDLEAPQTGRKAKRLAFTPRRETEAGPSCSENEPEQP